MLRAAFTHRQTSGGRPARIAALAIALTFGAGSLAGAQQTLTLEDAVVRALARNHDVQIERESFEIAGARMLGARGDYDLQLRVDFGARHRRDPVTSLFSGAPEGRVAASMSGLLGSTSLTQLFQTGAVASLTASVERQTSNSTYTLVTPAYITSVGVDVRQPLLQHRAIDPSRAALRITALDRERSSAALRRQVLETIAAVEQAYWLLVSAQRQVAIRRNSVTLAEQQRADTDIRIHARTIPVSDLAQPTAEVERRRGDVFGAQEQVARAERALKTLMLDDLADPMWAVTLAPVDMPESQVEALDIQQAIEDAARYRPELEELRATLSARDVEIALARNGLLPRLDLVASYVGRGLAGDHNPGVIPFGSVSTVVPDALDGGLTTSWNTLAHNRFPDAMVGVSFEVPIGKSAARGELGVAEAGRRQTQTAIAQTGQRIAMEVRNALTALETAASRIQAARAGLQAAEVQLRAEQDRFHAGATTNFFVLTRQTDLAQAQLTEIAAVTDYRQALTELGRATGTLLRDRGVQIERPTTIAVE
jgi:HAE1 family hydrophobic/amphiphilic exporter-1